jgi:hypothetical protein
MGRRDGGNAFKIKVTRSAQSLLIARHRKELKSRAALSSLRGVKRTEAIDGVPSLWFYSLHSTVYKNNT